jgi:HK97 gp10 family phage protein
MAREVIEIRGLEGVLHTLKSLPAELVSKRGGPVKTALRRAALVIQKQAKANIQAIMDEPNQGALPHHDPSGLLRDSIIVSRDPNPRASGANERYLVRIKKKKYPASRAGRKTVTTSMVGRLLETGTERRRPMPWMRPAFEAKKHEAVAVFVAVLTGSIDRIVRKLAKERR